MKEHNTLDIYRLLERSLQRLEVPLEIPSKITPKRNDRKDTGLKATSIYSVARGGTENASNNQRHPSITGRTFCKNM